MKEHFVIAIDGPASSGKSTVSKILAEDLNLIYVDTGAMYRALTHEALQAGIDLNNESALMKLLDEIEISFSSGSDQRTYVNDSDVTEAIRTAKVTNNVSTVSSFPKVREEMVERQRQIASKDSAILDGRDIGTVVFPRADLKIFLVATAEERAQRRYEENLSRGIETPLAQLKQEIELRDFKDSNRQESPLKKAEDAIEIDTTGLSIAEVVAEIKSHIPPLQGQ